MKPDAVHGFWAALGLFGLMLVTGFLQSRGAVQRFSIDDYAVEQLSWDTLKVDVAFQYRPFLGKSRSIQPDTFYIVAYNAAYDTLYAGQDSLIAIPDASLGHREHVLVELCASRESDIVCEQSIQYASSKRVELGEANIDYPFRKNYRQGRFTFPMKLTRQEFGGEGWDPIASSVRAVSGHMEAYVRGREGERLRIPINQLQGQFDFARYENFKDFKFNLDSALLDESKAQVHFDVYVDVPGIDEPVVSMVKGMRLKSDSEREGEVAALAQQAANQIIAHLNPFSSRARSVAYIDQWAFNRFEKSYRIEMEIAWRGSISRRGDYSLKGVLQVGEDGRDPTFRMVEADRYARRRWNSRVDEEMLSLLSLYGPGIEREVGPDAFMPANGLLAIEAEHFLDKRSARGREWTTEIDVDGMSNGAAVAVWPDRGHHEDYDDVEDSPELIYPVYITEPGTYYVWVRGWAPGGSSNSIHLGLNGRPVIQATRIETDQYRRWSWTQERKDRRQRASITFSAPGVYTLSMWMREDGYVVDKLILTTDSRFRPEGQGPAESAKGYPEPEIAEGEEAEEFVTVDASWLQ